MSKYKNLDSIDKEIRILVVDDYPMTRNMVKAILKGLGFADVEQAENGVQAVHRIMKGDIDCVICDWNMPNKNGLEVLTEVRAHPEFANLPFLMLTAEAYKESVIAAAKAGVSDYVVKPFTAEVLADGLLRIFQKHLS